MINLRSRLRRLERGTSEAPEIVPDESLPVLVKHEDGTVTVPRFDAFMSDPGIGAVFNQKRLTKAGSATFRNLTGLLRAFSMAPTS